MVGSTPVRLSGTRTQLSEEEDRAAVAVCCAGNLHGHLEPGQEERTTSRSVWKNYDRKMHAKKKTFSCFLLFGLELKRAS